MKGIVYLSKANVHFSPADLNCLTVLATRKNLRLGVTGCLYFFEEKFLQYIEGNDETVIALMEQIRADNRHRILFETEPEEIDTRLFFSWSMKLLTSQALNRVNLKGCTSQNAYFLNKNYADTLLCSNYLWQQMRTISLLQNMTFASRE